MVLFGHAGILDQFLLWRAEVGHAIPQGSWEAVSSTYCLSFAPFCLGKRACVLEMELDGVGFTL